MHTPNAKIKNWLILAHCFNMDGRAASQTITDRIPFLIENGILPVVLSAPHGTKDHRFPHYRVLSPAPSGILFEMRHIIKNNFKNLIVQKFLKALLTIVCLPFYLLEKIFIHLDSHWSWFWSASMKGYLLARKYQPELIYSTGGPTSTHVAGFILKKLLKIPWLAEIHDPLVYDNEKRKWQTRLFNRWLERTIFRNASAVIYFTERALEKANQRHPMKGKGYVLRPGALPQDFSGIRYERKKKIHFGHFGSLAEGRNLTVFIQALSELIKEKPDWGDRLSLDIYGAELDSVSRKCLSAYPLDEVLCQHGRLEYNPRTGKSGRQQVIEAMRQCDVLLLIHGEGTICEEYIPSKLYEYLLTCRPIIGMVSPDSELEKILIENGQFVTEGDNVDGVKRIIAELILKWETQGLPDHRDKSSFTVESAVRKLLSITEGIK